MKRLLLVAALLLVALPGQARTVSLCLAERELLPVSSARFEAPGQYLARLAIEHQGDRAVFTALPWRRCVAGVRNQQFDGAIGVVVTESFLTYMHFPMAEGAPDPSKSLGNIVFVAMRPVGSSASWDGGRFRNVTRPVLYNSAAQAIQDKLTQLGVPKNSDTPQEERMMEIMLSGRADIAVGREDAVVPLAESPAFRGRIEVLPRPFVSTPTYLAFRRTIWESDPMYVEAIWSDIARQRAAPDWEETARRLLEQKK